MGSPIREWIPAKKSMLISTLLHSLHFKNIWLLDSVGKRKEQIVSITREPAFPEGDLNVRYTCESF